MVACASMMVAQSSSQGPSKDQNYLIWGNSEPMSGAPQYVSINEAASVLGVKPWEVVRLIESGHVASVSLVDAASLNAYKEGQR